jgi:hypothetical protein
MPRRLAVVGDEFLATAPLAVLASVVLPHSCEQVWDALSSQDIEAWTGIFMKPTWLSDPPFTTGARRLVKVLGLITVHEEYYRWEPPLRASFRVTELNVPLAQGWVEDVQLERRDGGGTRLKLVMAFDNRLLRRIRLPRWLQSKVSAATEKAMSGIVNVLPRPDGR